MPDVDYHGWTHRPKAQGGTDPIEMPTAKWATAFGGAKSYSYSSGYYIPTFQTLRASDSAAFGLSDVVSERASWLQLNEPGYYHAWAYISKFGGAWGTEATAVETVFKNGAASERLDAGASLADFNLSFSRADQKLVSSAEPNSTLFQFNAFHWEPGNSDDLGDQDPLFLAADILSDGTQGSLSLVVALHVVKMAGPGYVSVNAADL